MINPTIPLFSVRLNKSVLPTLNLYSKNDDAVLCRLVILSRKFDSHDHSCAVIQIQYLWRVYFGRMLQFHNKVSLKWLINSDDT